MPTEQPFSDQDTQLLQEVSRAIRQIDVVRKSGEVGLEELLHQIIAICEDTETNIFTATNADKEYIAKIEIDHNTDPAEVRLYIHEKLKIKFGQIIEALKNRKGKTEILILTKDGYRETTPRELNRYRDGKNNHDKHITNFSLSSRTNILSFLLKLVKIIAPPLPS